MASMSLLPYKTQYPHPDPTFNKLVLPNWFLYLWFSIYDVVQNSLLGLLPDNNICVSSVATSEQSELSVWDPFPNQNGAASPRELSNLWPQYRAVPQPPKFSMSYTMELKHQQSFKNIRQGILWNEVNKSKEGIHSFAPTPFARSPPPPAWKTAVNI